MQSPSPIELLLTLQDSDLIFSPLRSLLWSPEYRCLSLYMPIFYHTQEKQLTKLCISQTSMESPLHQESVSFTAAIFLMVLKRYLSSELMPTSPICCKHLLLQPEWNCFINSEILQRCMGWLISCKVFIEHQTCFTFVVFFFLVAYSVWYMVLGLIIVIVFISINGAKWLT